jgi:hypothetical protein
MGAKGEAYQAFAHLWVGGLIGAAVILWPMKRASLCTFLASALSAVEVAAFLGMHR